MTASSLPVKAFETDPAPTPQTQIDDLVIARLQRLGIQQVGHSCPTRVFGRSDTLVRREHSVGRTLLSDASIR